MAAGRESGGRRHKDISPEIYEDEPEEIEPPQPVYDGRPTNTQRRAHGPISGGPPSPRSEPDELRPCLIRADPQVIVDLRDLWPGESLLFLTPVVRCSNFSYLLSLIETGTPSRA